MRNKTQKQFSNKQIYILGFSILGFMLVTSCDSQSTFESKLEKTLTDKPELIFKAIEKEPGKFMTVVQNAAKESQKMLVAKRKEEEDKKLAAAFSTPLEPTLRDDESFRGPKDAPITLVEYSDFQCPYCAKGSDTVKSLQKKYPGKIRFVFKHLPLDFHPQALISAKYYEAIRLQSKEKAFNFHDLIFSRQGSLKGGEIFLTNLAKELKVDMEKLQKDLNSKFVLRRIEQDLAEAKKFSMQGTPGFLLNGIPVRGAYPTEYFINIIDKLQSKGKLVL